MKPGRGGRIHGGEEWGRGERDDRRAQPVSG